MINLSNVPSVIVIQNKSSLDKKLESLDLIKALF